MVPKSRAQIFTIKETVINFCLFGGAAYLLLRVHASGKRFRQSLPDRQQPDGNSAKSSRNCPFLRWSCSVLIATSPVCAEGVFCHTARAQWAETLLATNHVLCPDAATSSSHFSSVLRSPMNKMPQVVRWLPCCSNCRPALDLAQGFA